MRRATACWQELVGDLSDTQRVKAMALSQELAPAAEDGDFAADEPAAPRAGAPPASPLQRQLVSRVVWCASDCGRTHGGRAIASAPLHRKLVHRPCVANLRLQERPAQVDNVLQQGRLGMEWGLGEADAEKAAVGSSVSGSGSCGWPCLLLLPLCLCICSPQLSTLVLANTLPSLLALSASSGKT